jgi:hypothetical protein
MKPKFFLGLLLVIGLFSLSTASVAFAASTPQPANARVGLLGHFDGKNRYTEASYSKPVGPFINRVSCQGRSDFFELYTDYGADPVCFANAGGTYVSIYNTAYLTTGNNTGKVVWDDGYGNYYTAYFPNKFAWGTIDYGNYVHVDYIFIY